MLDQIKGGLFGLAIGDALGAMTEKEIGDKYGVVTEMRGGGYWGVAPGETTDDTAMTLAVARGIMGNVAEPIEEIGRHFLLWENTEPKDMGVTVSKTFRNFAGDWFQAAEQTHFDLRGKSAGNGSLMRCLPIAIAYSDEKRIGELSIQQSKMTHFDDRRRRPVSFTIG
ncbi:ADP-ribosylglycohydrolase family protein [Sporosarcina sp. 179-K 3D1 HS]|uniref:ADP-ribosylglycohydrolase family protein n=1 Tax=Sporosarcina sp. 179-K 3D1 HS TaxID=3232169 RepID=UPI0039A16939